MKIEILITIGLVVTAVYILFNSFKTKTSGECGCGKGKRLKNPLSKRI